MTVVLDGLAYPIVLDAQADAHVARCLASRGIARAVLVFDRRLAALVERLQRALDAAGMEVIGSLGLAAGERIKRPAQAVAVARWLVQREADRQTAVVAVGGGSVTDLAGFAAAACMRGLPWVAVPTTLLGMVDAAIGGKTGVNLPEGKNLLGAFWDPVGVVADLESLRVLPRSQARTGFAEMVKAAIIGDPALFDRLEGFGLDANLERWLPLIAAAARVKIAVVAADPLERGKRAALNLGHTIGHALELASRYRFEHGRAVAVGLRAAGLLALACGRWSRHEHSRVLSVLRSAGLPLAAVGLSEDAVIEGLRRDKKRKAGLPRFVLPVKIGLVEVGAAVGEPEVRSAVRACLRAPGPDEL